MHRTGPGDAKTKIKYSVLRNTASGSEIGFMGRLSAGFYSGKFQNPGRELDFWPRGPIPGPEMLTADETQLLLPDQTRLMHWTGPVDQKNKIKHHMLLNTASRSDIGFPGWISAGVQSGKLQNLVQKPDFRPANPIAGPAIILRHMRPNYFSRPKHD